MKRKFYYLCFASVLLPAMLSSTVSFAQRQDSLLDQMKGRGSVLQNVDDVQVFDQVDKLGKALSPVSNKIVDSSRIAGEKLTQYAEAVNGLVDGDASSRGVGESNYENFDLVRRDPFALTSFMLERYNDSRQGGNAVFTPLGNIKVPELSLKGLMRKEGDEVIALLEIKNSGVFLVREGDTVGFRQGSNEHVLRIKKIDQLSVVVEAGNLGKVIVVR